MPTAASTLFTTSRTIRRSSSFSCRSSAPSPRATPSRSPISTRSSARTASASSASPSTRTTRPRTSPSMRRNSPSTFPCISTRTSPRPGPWRPTSRPRSSFSMPTTASATGAGSTTSTPTGSKQHQATKEDLLAGARRDPVGPTRGGTGDEGRRLHDRPGRQAGGGDGEGDLLPRRAADPAEQLPDMPSTGRVGAVLADEAVAGGELGTRHQGIHEETTDAAVEAVGRRRVPP